MAEYAQGDAHDNAAAPLPDQSPDATPKAATPSQDRGVPLGPGNFVDLGILGTGSSAVVHRASSETFNDVVALKVWHRPLTEEERPRFQQECSLHRRLSGHPNIVRFLWADAPPVGSAWIATELCDESLANRLRRGPALSVEDAFVLAEDVLSGLAEIHRQGHVHRDIKPSNVLLRGGRAVLCDLGIAKPVDRHTLNAPAGSPGYLAPELGRGRQPDFRSDVYSAAVTLYDIFGGNPPARVESLLTRAESSEPADRPADAGVFLEHLQAAHADHAAPDTTATIAQPREDSGIGAMPAEAGSPLTKLFERPPGSSPRRHTLMLLGVVVAGLAALTASAPDTSASGNLPVSSASPADSSGAAKGVLIQSHDSGRCIDVSGGSAVDHTPLRIWDCTGVARQKWRFASDGTVRLLGKCMDVDGGSKKNGAVIQLADCNGTAAQRFRLNPAHDLVNTQADKCVDVKEQETDNGTGLQLWECAGAANQKWSKA